MGKQTTVEKSAEKEQQAASAAPVYSGSATSNQPTRVNKAKDTLSVLTAALPIIGACGTLFVWITANFYVGDVEVACPDKYEHILVKVFDNKGRESQYHTPKFQVWPGAYHFEISADDGKAHHADATVEFHEKTTIPLTLAAPVQQSSQNEPADEPAQKRSWWKFWRR